jgi:hypothetical protein
MVAPLLTEEEKKRDIIIHNPYSGSTEVKADQFPPNSPMFYRLANFRRQVRNILENGCTPGFRNNHPGGELYDIDNPEVRYDVHSRPPQERLSNLADNGPPNNVSILGRLLSEGSSLEGRQIAAAADDEVERQIQESLAAAGYLPGEDASDGDDDSIGRGGIMDDYYNDGSDSDDSRRHPLLAHPLDDDDDDNDIRQRQREEDIQATLDLVAQRQREEERLRDDDDNDNQGSSGGRRSKTKRNKQSKRKQSKRKQSKRKQSKRKQSKRKQSKRKQSKRKYIKPNKRPILTNKNANKRRKQTRRR